MSLRPCINGDRPIEAWREEEGQADGGDREIVCALAVAAAEHFYGASAQSLYLALLATLQGTMRMLHFVDRLVHRPVKAGLRLPWKASTPSRKSCEERSRL